MTEDERRKRKILEKQRARRKAGAKTRDEIQALAAERAQHREVARKRARRGLVWRRLWLVKGETEAERYRRRYQDTEFRLAERMRTQVRKAAANDRVAEAMRSALRRGGGSRMVERLLGYTIDELRSHLEKQFTRGMSWEALNRGEIHIDHIVPKSSFDLGDEDQWRACWCLTNLRPLWARENLQKGASICSLL